MTMELSIFRFRDLRLTRGWLTALRELKSVPKIPAFILIIVVIIAIFAPLITPHSPIRTDLTARELPPAWAGLSISSKTVVEEGQVQDSKNEMSITAARQLRPGNGIGQSPNVSEDLKVGNEIQVVTRLAGSIDYLLGTDRQGRDILSRIVEGSRASLSVAFLSILFGGTFGTVLGLVAGYRGGWVDSLIMRTVDVWLAIPGILIGLVLALRFGPGYWIVVSVLSVILWARYARLIRGEVLSWKARDFIALAKVAGASSWRIIFVHILPNTLNSIIVLSTLQVGWAIIALASLSFLGVGIPPPAPSWGGMISEGRNFVETFWWISVFPGIAIMLVVISANMFGDWLRDVLDPNLRQI